MKDDLNNNDLIVNNSLAINSSNRQSGASEYSAKVEIKEKEEKLIKDDTNEKNELLVINDNSTEIGLSCYRYIIVVIFFFLNFINGMHWITFAACAAKFGKFYNLNNLEVDCLSIIYMAMYILTCVFCSYYIDKI